jgi:short-subunit dehydrogenase
MTSLIGRTALITGASTGIGAATARVMAKRGARVLLVARSEGPLRELAEAIGGGAAAYPTDVGDAEAVGAMAERIKADVGVPDVIVNNAGAGRFLFIEDTSPEELVQMTKVPYFAAFFVTRAFIEDMLARGSGHIANVNTPASTMPWPGALGYAGARWAVRGFTKALRADLHGTGIRVTEIVPGKVSSDYFKSNPGAEERIPSVARVLRTLTPEQTGELIARAVERNKREAISPFLLRMMYLQDRFAPRLTEWIVHRTGSRRPAS